MLAERAKQKRQLAKQQTQADIALEGFTSSETTKELREDLTSRGVPLPSEEELDALSLQFNRLSALSDAEFVELHELLGQAPGLDDVAAYQSDLIAARTLIGTAYGFDAGNLIAW